MPSDQIAYLRARAAEERKRATAATDPNIRAIHLEFALRYERILTEAARDNILQGSRKAIDHSMALLKATSTQAPGV